MKNPNDMFWYVGGYRATFLWASKGRCLEPPDRHALWDFEIHTDHPFSFIWAFWDFEIHIDHRVEALNR
jgi:hypothetical protein